MRRLLTVFFLFFLCVTSSAAQQPTALLSGSVIDTAAKRPVAQAQIAINGVPLAATTDDGRFSVAVPTAAANTQVTVRITAPGFGTWKLRDVTLNPGETRELRPAFLGPEPITQRASALVDGLRTPQDVEAARLLEEGRGQGLGTSDLYLPRGMDTRAGASHYIIPLTIKVGITPYIHCSDWLAAGQPVTRVDVVDFKEYIKNVLPNEWVYTWHPNSLKAGAMAAKSFAWWRMTFSSSPRPQGADVVDNTCDQVYIANSRRDPTNAAVDETWHLRMSRDNRMTAIHYLAYDSQCADASWYPAEPCMGQHESQYKALEGWSWEDILHFYYDPVAFDTTTVIPPDVNVLSNSGFGSGYTGWTLWGTVQEPQVVEGAFSFYRQGGSQSGAVIYQDVNTSIPAQTPLRLKVRLGNTSAVTKTISVHLHASDSWVGAISCAFTLPPHTPLQNYMVWGAPETAWEALRVELIAESADGLAAYLVDKVKAVYVLEGKPDHLLDCEAPRPGVPVITAPVASSQQDNPFTVTLTPGASNLRPGYADSFQVQVSTTDTFGTTVFDNDGALADNPTVSVTLPNGTYYVRARQFDGLDRYSHWSAPVMFTVKGIPGQPTLLTPQDNTSFDVNTLTFTWSQTVNTAVYKLRLYTAEGTLLTVETFPLAERCAEGTCSGTLSLPATTFTDGASYTWDVQAKQGKKKTRSLKFTFTANLP